MFQEIYEALKASRHPIASVSTDSAASTGKSGEESSATDGEDGAAAPSPSAFERTIDDRHSGIAAESAVSSQPPILVGHTDSEAEFEELLEELNRPEKEKQDRPVIGIPRQAAVAKPLSSESATGVTPPPGASTVALPQQLYSLCCPC